MAKWFGIKMWRRNSIYLIAGFSVGAIAAGLAGCSLLGDPQVAPAPAVPTVADIAQLPPTPTPMPIPPTPTAELPTPTLPAPLVSPAAIPTITPLAIPTVTPQPSPTPRPTVTPAPEGPATAVAGEDGRIFLGDQLILDPASDVGGCFDPGEISYSPAGTHFVVVLACFEGDNHAFVFRSDGSQKRQITGQWDHVNYYEYEWSPDGKEFIYQRIDSCCAEPPPDAPPPGRVSFNVETGQKTFLDPTPTPLPAEETVYRVINVASDDVLNIRSGPGVSNGIIGTIPPNGTGVRIIGGGTTVGGYVWVPIQYGGVTGWVNSVFLAEE